NNDINGLSFSKDGKRLFASTKNKLQCFDLVSNKLIASSAVEENRYIRTTALSPDGKKLFLGCEVYGGKVSPAQIGLPADPAKYLALRSIVGGELQVREIDFAKKDPFSPISYRIAAHKEGITYIGFSSDTNSFACCSTDGSISLWRSTDCKKLGDLVVQDALPDSLTFSPGGTILAGCFRDNRVI